MPTGFFSEANTEGERNLEKLNIRIYDDMEKIPMMICDRKICTGCGACAQSCPKRCIAMKPDACGFSRPEIDSSACIECGLCQKICPARNEPAFKKTLRVCKASPKPGDLSVAASSCAGAVSKAMEAFLKQGCSVYATAFTEGLNVRIRRLESAADLSGAQGSKYVQSASLNSFAEAREELKSGKTVLYVGTPCQIAGLYSCAGNAAENLYTIDLLCASVASPLVYEGYIGHLRRKYGDIDRLNFRDKKYGYGFYVTSVVSNGRKRTLNGGDGAFCECIGKGLVRPSCLECPYRRAERLGDLTVGDYGYRRASGSEKKLGANILFVNSEKGEYLAGLIGGQLQLGEADPQVIKEKRDSTPMNPDKKKNEPAYYDAFFETALQKGWENAYSRFLRPRGAKAVLKSMIPKAIYYKLLSR